MTPSACANDGRDAARRTRLSPEREAELLTAVLDELRETGYDSLTMEAVAARSRSSKATLYRQWGSKPRLVAAAVRHGRPFSLSGVDTGTLAGDLDELGRRICRAKKDRTLVRALAPAVHRDKDLAAAMHEALIKPELDVLVSVLERAVARGEVAPDNPANPYLPHLISGALFARQFVEQREPDAAYMQHYVDTVVLPLLQVRT